MSTIKFNRLHFFKRFNPDADYIVLKDMVIGGVEMKRGAVFDKTLMPMYKIKRLFETRKITPDYSLYNPADISAVVEQKEQSIETNTLTTDENSVIVIPEVRAAGPAWFKVWLNEEQIGKTVRTKYEAQAIVDEWLENQKK